MAAKNSYNSTENQTSYQAKCLIDERNWRTCLARLRQSNQKQFRNWDTQMANCQIVMSTITKWILQLGKNPELCVCAKWSSNLVNWRWLSSLPILVFCISHHKNQVKILTTGNIFKHLYSCSCTEYFHRLKILTKGLVTRFSVSLYTFRFLQVIQSFAVGPLHRKHWLLHIWQRRNSSA